MSVSRETLTRWRAQVERARVALFGDRPDDALDAVLVLAAELDQSGADRPAHMAPYPDVPLELLDTQANRRYLAALTEAVEAGRAVDEERGYGDGGPVQLVEMLLARTLAEVIGPAGSGE